MQGRNYLGIYLGKDTATVVCLGSQPRERNLLACFSVSVEDRQADQTGQTTPAAELAALIAQGCAERGLEFSDVALALDSAMFIQHNVHSDFVDPKQIAATIRFDTEEALAMDVAEVAIAFQLTLSDQAGSDLAVFTTQRKILSDIILALQSNILDPITVEPDVNCLSRFIWRTMSLPEDSHPFFCLLSRRNGYFIVPHQWTGPGPQKPSAMRTFLIGPSQNRTELLARELPVTTALVETDKPVNHLNILDSTGSVDHRQLAEKLSIDVSGVDVVASAKVAPQDLADCADTIQFAIAYGAALAHLEKANTINFRSDFMPYQGKKVRLQKTLKFAAFSITILALAVGMYLQSQLLQKNRYRSRLRNKSQKQYSAVMFGKKLPRKANPAKKLAGELRRIQNLKKGQFDITGEESISAKLTMVLDAFNKCAAKTDLHIDTISITTKTITITGDTSSRGNTLKLRKAIEKSGLSILSDRLEEKGNRDNFHITVAPKKIDNVL